MAVYLRKFNVFENLLYTRSYRVVLGLAYKHPINVYQLNKAINSIAELRSHNWLKLRHTINAPYTWYYDHTPLSCSTILGNNTLTNLIAESVNYAPQNKNPIEFLVQDNKLIITIDHTGVDGRHIMKTLEKVLNLAEESNIQYPSPIATKPPLLDLHEYFSDKHYKSKNPISDSKKVKVVVPYSHNDYFDQYILSITDDKYQQYEDLITKIQSICRSKSFSVGPAALLLTLYANSIYKTYHTPKSLYYPINCLFSCEHLIPTIINDHDVSCFQSLTDIEIPVSIKSSNLISNVISNGRELNKFKKNPKLLEGACKYIGKYPYEFFGKYPKEDDKATELIFELTSVGNYNFPDSILEGPYATQYRKHANNNVIFSAIQDRKHKRFNMLLMTSQGISSQILYQTIVNEFSNFKVIE